jgi:hypothetical protein
MASNTTYSRPACRQGLGQVLEQAQLGDDAVGDDEDLAVTETGNGLSQLALAPGPTRIVGCGMGRKRTARPAPFMAAPSAVVRSESLIKSDIKESLLQNDRPPGFSLCLRRALPFPNLELYHPTSAGGIAADHVGGLFRDHQVGAVVLPPIRVGMIEASTTRRPSRPCTRSGSRPPPSRRCPSCRFRPGDKWCRSDSSAPRGSHRRNVSPAV